MNAEELKLILEEGESYRIEFKEALSGIDREMVAFANASGGRLFIGVTDRKAVRGIPIDNRLKSQVQDIANQCQPPVKILIEDYNSILIIHVREGDDKPYKCASGFYLRVGPNTQKLNRNEIVAFIKAEGKVRFDELLCTRFNYPKQFDGKKLNDFLNLSAITPPRDKTLALVNLGAAEKQEGKTVFNNSGVLFFSKNLDDIYHHTTVTCALYAGTEKADVQDRRDFNEDILSSIDRGMIFLKQYIPVRYEMTGMPQRREIPEIPYDALREALINAVAHRDYFEKGANVIVEIFDDRIDISNPGGLVKGMSLKDLGEKSVLRNPNIASLLHRVRYIEKMGTGVTKMRKLMREAGLLPPLFESGYFFTATFRRHKREKRGLVSTTDPVDRAIRETIDETINETVNETVRKHLALILDAIYHENSLSGPQLENILGMTRATAKRSLALLKTSNLVIFSGAPKTGKYLLTEQAKHLIEEMLKKYH